MATTAQYRAAHLAGSEGRDLAPSLRALADEDPKIDLAHDAGRAGTPFTEFAAAQGSKTPSSAAPSKPSGGPAPLRYVAGKLSGGRTENFGSVLLGLVIGALALSVLDYGPKGPLLWFEAKFLNQAAPGPSGSAPSAPGSSGPRGPASAPTTQAGPQGPYASNAVLG